jgi:CubicO group peptidase (beta-lactamase class C family)
MPYWMGPDFTFPTQPQLRELLGGQSTIYPADHYFQYSNLALSLVGEIVAEQSEQSYERYVDEHILQPLRLSDSATGFPTDQREDRVATGYGYSGRDGKLPPLPRYAANAITPAAGFASTALDLARFASWQFRVLDGQSDAVLASNTLREMQRVQWMDWDWSVARGLAFGVYRIGGRTLTGHAGSCPGFSTRLFLDPLSRYAVITMANRNRVDVDGYATTLLDILEADGAASEPAAAISADTPDFTPYLGNYDSRPWDGEDLVFRWKDGLAMVSLPTMTPTTSLVRLKHVEGDRFQTIRSDEQAGHEVSFRRNNAGQVTHLVYHGVVLPKL